MLTGPEIVRQRYLGAIIIEPFIESHVGPNSYDLRLSDELLVYDPGVLDMKSMNAYTQHSINSMGKVLQPGELYLGSSIEVVGAEGFSFDIDGRSSVGRLGMEVHISAGFCDDGFKGTITLEISVVRPLRVYAGVRICQISFNELVGQRQPYKGKYIGQVGPRASGMWRDKEVNSVRI
jgi:dCTP deaminase